MMNKFFVIIFLSWSITSYSQPGLYLPKRPLLADTVSFPIFISGNENIKSTIYDDIRKIYKAKHLRNKYSYVFFRLYLDEHGHLRNDTIVSVTQSIRHDFHKHYKSIIHKLGKWTPAKVKDSGVAYSLYFEIEYDNRDKQLKMSITNTDLQSLLTPRWQILYVNQTRSWNK